MVELRNEQISITVSEKGAELQSIKDANGKEYLWQGDPAFWPRRSPILFPIVCSVNNDTYQAEGQEYHLPRHGFARDTDFKLISRSDRKVTFALESSEETRKVYPYDFTLSVSYAFNIPDMKAGESQYGRIRLDNAEPLDGLKSYIDGSHEMIEVPVETEQGVIEFSDNTWRNDSVKIHKSQVHRAELLNKAGEPEVTLEFRTPVIAFWSPYGKEAPFVCIEPWYGLGDPRGFLGAFKDKPLMNHLQPGASFMSKYDIIIG